MHQITVNGVGKGREKMEMPLEDVEHGFDFTALSQKEMLPRRHEFPLLFAVRQSENEGLGSFPEKNRNEFTVLEC